MEEKSSSFKKNLILVVLTAALGALGIGTWQFFQFHDGKLHLVFCDVGQGDAIYLKTPGNQEVLIDGGPDEKVLDCLSSHRPFYDRTLDILILTHPEADHLTGLIPVLERYKVDYLIVENIFNPSAVFAKFQREVRMEKMKIFNPSAGDRIKLGEVEINFFWPKLPIGKKQLWLKELDTASQSLPFSESSNNYSLIFNIKYQDFGALITGDAESPILEEALDPSLKALVLKVPHHGSKKALSAKILNFLRPELAVISVGKGNHFGHPTGETLKILRDLDIKILRTDQDGEVGITSDGQRLVVR